LSNRPAPADLDFRKLVHAGDLVVWGQGCAEPRGLTEAILAQRASLGGIRCMIGVPAPQTSVRAEHADHVAFLSYTGSGVNRALHQRGALDILPSHYSQLPRVFTRGARAADVVVLLQVPPPDASGHYSLGLANEYLSSAIDHARTVIVEVNESVPRTGGRLLDPDAVDVVTHSELAPSAMPIAEPGTCEQLIARHVAQLIDDGSTLQIGLGAVPEAVLAELSDHRGLGVHSGLLSDGMMKLMQCGAIDNSRKGIDVGISVGGVVMGSTELIEFADSNPAIEVRETEYTHSSDVIAGLHKFVSINSAIEVDLSGQVNAEVARGRYVGAVGGAVDFARGAQRCADGLAIIALPSTVPVASSATCPAP
jgi:acetyl-CoA hydrolase